MLALERKYGGDHRRELYRMELKGRFQKSGETLQEFAADIERLVHLAHSSMAPEYTERIKMDAFIDGIRDPETRRSVVLSPKLTFAETVVYALTIETAYNTIKPTVKIQRGEIRQPPIQDNNRSPTRYSDGSGEIRCWGCDRAGHLLRDCRESWRKSSTRHSDENGKIRCWGCDRKGHLLRDCRELQRKSPTRYSDGNGEIHCWGCDGTGHMFRECRELWRKQARTPSPVYRRPDEEGEGLVGSGNHPKTEALARGPCRADDGACDRVEDGEQVIEVRRMQVVPAEKETKKELHEIHQSVRNRLKGSSDRARAHYEVRANGRRFEEGQLVWLHSAQRKRGLSRRLQPGWEGPYKVIARLNDIIYRIQRGKRGKPKIVHLERLALYRGRGLDPVRDEQV